MREKLQTLPVAVLKEMAKKQGIKGATALRKAELIEALCNAAEENIGHETAVPENSQPTRTSYQNRGQNGRPAAARRNNNAQGEQQSYQNRQNQNGEQTYQNRQNQNNEQPAYQNNRDEIAEKSQEEMDSGVPASGILEVMPDGFGFIRCENFLPGENDVYVSPTQIRRFNLKTGDIINGNRRVKTSNEKFAALLYIKNVNGYPVSALERRPNFEDLTPIFPNSRLHMETQGKSSTAMRVLDLLAPIGKGQRGMIVSPPKAGKTTLLKQVAQAVTNNHPDMHMIILLIDERPEEVTDIKESVVGNNVEVIYSTFDELPERHKRVSEMVIERAKRLVEHGRDVIILLDSITRLARAYNLVVPPSGRTLSGGLDPAALHMPKRFFGAARNMREGGSLTILATALVDTGSRMDDVIYEEFKGTGNMELVLDRKLSEKRIFPAIDILKSGTRRDDLLLSRDEAEAVDIVRKATNSLKPEDSVERILDLFAQTRTNREFVEVAKKRRMF
ncbi:MAG: transcription termination factor Rho [Clostridium sp.]